MKNIIYIIFFCFIFLNGCAKLTEKPSAFEQKTKWVQHQLVVDKINKWHIKGRISISTDRVSGIAAIYWEQSNSNYKIRIVAPLGQGTYILSGSQDGVYIQGSNNIKLTNKDPEKLMKEVLGWSVNIDNLRYWVRGLPAPNISHELLSLNDEGLLEHLQQSGVNLTIKRYKNFAGILLPKKITIKKDNLKLNIAIVDWFL